MSAKQEAKAKISAGEKGGDKVHSAWNAAHEALAGGVSMNGSGIYHDQGDPLRRKLLETQAQIKIAAITMGEL
ncbi:hypothetical protein HA052_19540 [Chromobacterium haemolyticum]|uniref:Uncharacterized protein n=1 Tax=Chromobacterium fluminis TaxID=3044269 RepID=A0ABX0L6E7_9NEIS|nr:hypothetical protein [Chromobacterium haemolyticum]NHR07387.1 hypothetical protein [Chromobacterium haemolyticum]